jgi:hypothetical protein
MIRLICTGANSRMPGLPSTRAASGSPASVTVFLGNRAAETYSGLRRARR